MKWKILAVTGGLVALIVVALAMVHKDPLANLRRSSEGLTGQIYFPRGGPYIVGFSSPDLAELVIDGKTVAVGRGQVTQRVIYETPGPRTITFRGPPGSRLLWHPPGRRGAPEYVSPSSLSPDGNFGAAPGTQRTEGLLLLALLAVLGGGALALVRPQVLRLSLASRPHATEDGGNRASPGHRTLLAVGGIFLFALVVRLIGLHAAGQTWDEDEYWSSGRNYVLNLLNLDFSEASWRWNHEHPPITKYIAGLGALLTDGYGGARFLFALIGAGTCALVVSIGRRLFCLRVGIFAGAICALTPHLIAHARVVGHETPSVFLWALAVLLALRAAAAETTGVLARRLLWLGLALGLAAGTRFTNLLVVPVAGIALLAAGPIRRWGRIVGLGAAIVPLAALATFVATWPLMWRHPFRQLDAAWDVLKRPHLPESFLGGTVIGPPWYYFPAYALATTPVLILILVSASPVRAFLRRERKLIVVLAWLLLPFGVAFSPVRQDGVRYVLPVFLAIALAAGASLDLLAGLHRRLGTAVVGTVLGLYLLVTCVRIYPYYLDYYGEQVGGPANVARNKLGETAWWGEGIAEAVSYVNAHAEQGAVVARLVQPAHVTWFRGDLWPRLTDNPAGAGWIVVNNLWEASRPARLPPGATLVHEVRAQGASLVRVYQVPKVEAP
jgi:4-amino-4-deoxy-L-arabinose transferase-like glycosyltransferase